MELIEPFRTSKDNYGGIIQMAELSFINRGFDVFVEGIFFSIFNRFSSKPF